MSGYGYDYRGLSRPDAPSELRITEEPLWRTNVGQDTPGQSKLTINGEVYVLVDMHNDGVQTHRIYRSATSLRESYSYGRNFEFDRPAFDLPKFYTMPPLPSLDAAAASRRLTALIQQGKARLEPAAVISV